jgi:uncharacterized membrane protein
MTQIGRVGLVASACQHAMLIVEFAKGGEAMSFLLLICALSLLAYIPQYFFGNHKDYRMALRHGLAGGLTLTGLDHFAHAQTRYVPMLPDVLAAYALELVYATGIAELTGALGLVMPLAVYRRLGIPHVRQWVGIGLAVMFALLVIANINVALKGSHVQGLEFGAWYTGCGPCCNRSSFSGRSIVLASLEAGVTRTARRPSLLRRWQWFAATRAANGVYQGTLAWEAGRDEFVSAIRYALDRH